MRVWSRLGDNDLIRVGIDHEIRIVGHHDGLAI